MRQPLARVLVCGCASIVIACGTSTATCLATDEPRALTCSGGSVARSGDTLRISLGAQQSKLLVNTNGESDLSYQYVGRLGSRGYHVVEQLGGEHPAYFLVMNPRSGLAVSTTGMPVVSPDNNRFASATPEWDCAESPDQRLAIWRLVDSLPVREWEVAPLQCGTNGATSGWAALKPVWRSSDTLAFTREEQPSNRRHVGLVAWDGHAWHLL